MLKTRITHISLASFLAGIAMGCGGSSENNSASISEIQPSHSSASAPAYSDSPANQSAESQPSDQPSPSATITASISNPVQPTPSAQQPLADSQTDDSQVADPEAANTAAAVDEATKILQQIQQLRIAAAPTDLEQARKARRERNDKIVELATNVLRLTMNDEKRQPQFRQAIGQLLEARFQNALVGTPDDIEQLYADIQALDAHDPKSVAAAEGVYYAARFAHTKAGLLGKSQPEWFETLSRWAREFSDRFPNQQQRAVSLLFGAARSCELHALTATDSDLAQRLMTESKLCYTSLAENFPQTPQGQESTAVLRRMAVTGQQLSQFSGPTIDGGLVSAEDFTGKPTLIYFWSSEDAEFVEQMLPKLQQIRNQAGPDRLRMIGVPLEEQESQLEAFMESNAVPGAQIFFPNPDQRSWSSPLIRFWGLSKCPSIWLVDSSGTVVSTSLSSNDIVPALRDVFQK